MRAGVIIMMSASGPSPHHVVMTTAYLKLMPGFSPGQEVIVVTNFHMWLSWNKGCCYCVCGNVPSHLTYSSCTPPGPACSAVACHPAQSWPASDPDSVPPRTTAPGPAFWNRKTSRHILLHSFYYTQKYFYGGCARHITLQQSDIKQDIIKI